MDHDNNYSWEINKPGKLRAISGKQELLKSVLVFFSLNHLTFTYKNARKVFGFIQKEVYVVMSLLRGLREFQ